MARLPTELLDEILYYVADDQRDLRECAVASPLLLPLARKHLFDEIVLRTPSLTPAEKRLELVHSSIVPHVRHIKIFADGDSTIKPTFYTLMERLGESKQIRTVSIFLCPDRQGYWKEYWDDAPELFIAIRPIIHSAGLGSVHLSIDNNSGVFSYWSAARTALFPLSLSLQSYRSDHSNQMSDKAFLGLSLQGLFDVSGLVNFLSKPGCPLTPDNLSFLQLRIGRWARKNTSDLKQLWQLVRNNLEMLLVDETFWIK
ncbi:hypothetical protein H0H93_016247, partial [Arthromyces matolae]